jgi:hypothetical protein
MIIKKIPLHPYHLSFSKIKLYQCLFYRHLELFDFQYIYQYLFSYFYLFLSYLFDLSNLLAIINLVDVSFILPKLNR